MIRRIVFALTLIVALCACGLARADFVTLNEGGYGPFTCEQDGGGPLPSWGYSETWTGSFYSYGCERRRGAIATNGYVGKPYSLPADPFESIRVSPQYTTGYACSSIVPGNAPVPCDSWVTAPPDNPYTNWRNGLVVGYAPPCPSPSPTMNSIYMCSGAWTPYDSSGIATAVISDGIVKPGLPHGSPLKLQPGGVTGVGVECLATLANYPSVPNLGRTQVMAVYDCP